MHGIAMARVSSRRAVMTLVGSLCCLPAVTTSFVAPVSSVRHHSRPVATLLKASSLALRPATPDDLALMIQWEEHDYMQDEAIFGDADYNEWNWEFELDREATVEWRQILIAEYACKNSNENNNSNIPIGVVQVLDPFREESQYWGNGKDGRKNLDYVKEFCRPELRAIDIWIGEPDYLGRGLGTQMMQHALRDHCFNDPTVTAVLVDPMATNPDAIRFHQNKCGFEPVGLRQFGPDKCLVHRLERDKWEQMQLQESL